MKVAIRLAFALALFLTTAGTVYAVTAREWEGAVMILACAAAALYIGLALRTEERHATRPTDVEPGDGPEEPEEVQQTIWPFVASIALLLLVIGAVWIHWVLVLSVIVLVGAGAGWFVDIQRQRVEAGSGEEVSALEGHEQPDDHDRS